MPKQLKIIVDEEFYNKDAPFTVNFAAPVIVAPGNKIALDKFTAVINNISSGFTLPNTGFDFYYALNDVIPNSQNVFIPGRRYENIIQLLNAISSACNNSFTAVSPDLDVYDREKGLKIVCNAITNTSTATTNTFQMQYATSDLLPIVMDWINMAVTVGSYYYPVGSGEFLFYQNDKSIVFLRGGGGLIRFQVVIPTIEQAIENQCYFSVGLADNFGKFHGLYQNELGELFLENGDIQTQIDLADFPVGPDNYCEIYQINGLFVLRYFTFNNDETITELFNSNINYPGALGDIDYTQSYNFEADGFTVSNTFEVPAISSYVVMTADIPMTYDNIEPATQRNVAFDMSNSGSLRAGLDVPSGLNVLSPQNSPKGSFSCQSSINMAIVNSSFDVALEILDLPLQTFQASSDRKPGQRNNVVAYFHPEFSQVGTGTYIYDSRSYQWLDIDITYPVNLSSLSFRVYDPDTGVGLDALSMSFNLLISADEY